MNYFFAIEIPNTVRQEISAQVARWRLLLHEIDAYRWINPLDYQVTLMFLGDVNETGEDRAVQLATSVAKAMDSLIVTLAPPSVFLRKTPGSDCVLWLGVHHNEALAYLATQLRYSIGDVDVLINRSSRSINSSDQFYKPHLTFARGNYPPDFYNVKLRYEQRFPSWKVDGFVLMQTLPPEACRNGGKARYNIVRTFPFGNPQS